MANLVDKEGNVPKADPETKRIPGLSRVSWAAGRRIAHVDWAAQAPSMVARPCVGVEGARLVARRSHGDPVRCDGLAKGRAWSGSIHSPPTVQTTSVGQG